MPAMPAYLLNYILLETKTMQDINHASILAKLYHTWDQDHVGYQSCQQWRHTCQRPPPFGRWHHTSFHSPHISRSSPAWRPTGPCCLAEPKIVIYRIVLYSAFLRKLFIYKIKFLAMRCQRPGIKKTGINFMILTYYSLKIVCNTILYMIFNWNFNWNFRKTIIVIYRTFSFPPKNIIIIRLSF